MVSDVVNLHPYTEERSLAALLRLLRRSAEALALMRVVSEHDFSRLAAMLSAALPVAFARVAVGRSTGRRQNGKRRRRRCPIGLQALGSQNRRRRS